MNSRVSGAPVAHSAALFRRKRISVIWIVPIVAAVVAGWLVYDRVRNVGPAIMIVFEEGQGLQAGQTAVRFRGVKIGDVRSVSLTPDGRKVEVRVVLDKSAKNVAREGALFWVVRPEVSAGGLRGLDTLVSGTYIQVEPGRGREQKQFDGLENPPMISSTKPGLEIDLTSPELGSLTLGAPVYYRGMEVGAVEFYSRNEDATQVKVRVRIDTRYAPLVTQNTKFWNAGGLNVSLKLFGVNMSAETMKSLVAGGIAFATPPLPGPPVAKGAVFPLHEKVDEKWPKWATPLQGWETNKSMESGHE